MRKIGWLSLVMLSAVFGLVNMGQAATHTVPTDFPTIEAAISDSGTHDGDTINVLPGTYYPPTGGYTVNKALTIKGQSGALKTFIETVDDSSHGFVVVVSNVTISGFTIHPPAGMVVVGNTIGIILGGTSLGVAVGSPAANIKVLNCIVEFFDYGILIQNAPGALVQGNTVRYQIDIHSSHGFGIYLLINASDYDITNAKITNNLIHDNGGWGICLVDTRGRTFAGTTISSNTLFNNFCLDSTPPSNNNRGAIYFLNANGTINVSSNKILALNPTSIYGPIEINTSPGVVKSNNHSYPGLKGTLFGTAVLIP